MPMQWSRSRPARGPNVRSLAEVQRGFRHAVVTGEAADVVPLLVGGGDVAARVRIHHRHYQTSLVEALVGKYPATAWLIGTEALREAARAFVREYPPRALCIAEYGDEFPRFVGEAPTASRTPYLHWFAELERHLAKVSLAVDEPPMDIGAVAALGTGTMVDMGAQLQPGLRYLDAPWPVDELMRLYLTDTAPEQLAFVAEDVWLEIRGARGQFTMRRLDAAEWAFRRALGAGRSLGEAAEEALETGVPFEAGVSLMSLLDDGLITTMALRAPGRFHDRLH